MTNINLIPAIPEEPRWNQVAVVGLGLIGGSLALRLKSTGLALKIIGVDSNESHGKLALRTSIIDQYSTLHPAIEQSQLILLATPVNSIPPLLTEILSQTSAPVVIDMGSTKAGICNSVASHPCRGRFVAAHPMWGTEFSGPEAATIESFTGKAAIICEPDKSDDDALTEARFLFETLGMHLLYMTPREHDLHTAYVSHLAHITSFALANTVLEKEKEEKAIFELASAGFDSTVRLAKSNPDTWVPIMKENKDHLLDVLNEHMSQLRKFKSCLEKENWEYLYELMQDANDIKRILNRNNDSKKINTPLFSI